MSERDELDMGRRVVGEDERQRYVEQGWWRDRTHLDDFLDAASGSPHKAAVVSYTAGAPLPTTFTYGQLAALVDRCAGVLIDLGVDRGDVVSIQVPNGWEFPVITLATMRAGAVPNPIPHIYRKREVEFMVRHAKSKVFITRATFNNYAFGDLARELAQEVPTLAHAVVIGADAEALGGELTSFEEQFLTHPRELDPGLETELDKRRPMADDLAVLLFTSGTTGTPKAAMHSHNSVWSAGEPIPHSLGLTSDDVCFMASTVGHLTGFYWGTLVPLSMGQTVVYQDIWNARQLVDMIDRERISWTVSATPFALDMIEAQKEAPRSLESFRAFACGGAPIPPQVATAMHEHLNVDLVSLWGCTESGINTIHQLGAPIEVLANSDGMPVRQMELRIVDDNNDPVPDGEEGRLQARGPSIFVGYMHQPERTAEMFTDDGWFDTGDLGRRTEDGGVRISGRSKDIIIRGGQNIPVVEIENELLNHPMVRDAVVVGYPDDRLGERGCAVVVPEDDPPTLDGLVAHLDKAGMAKQFWPERLEVVSALPRTPSGKVQKFVLRDRLREGKPLEP